VGAAFATATAFTAFLVFIRHIRRKPNDTENNRTNDPCPHQAGAPCLNFVSAFPPAFLME